MNKYCLHSNWGECRSRHAHKRRACFGSGKASSSAFSTLLSERNTTQPFSQRSWVMWTYTGIITLSRSLCRTPRERNSGWATTVPLTVPDGTRMAGAVFALFGQPISQKLNRNGQHTEDTNAREAWRLDTIQNHHPGTNKRQTHRSCAAQSFVNRNHAWRYAYTVRVLYVRSFRCSTYKYNGLVGDHALGSCT